MTSFYFTQKALILGFYSIFTNKNLFLETTIGRDYFVLYEINLKALEMLQTLKNLLTLCADLILQR